MKLYIKTYGCQMNELDSEVMAGTAHKMGFDNAESFDDADVIVFNTCSVREKAEERFFGRIAALKRLKKKKPNLVFVVAGCIAQQKKDEIQKRIPHVDLVIGTLNKKDFAPLLKKVINEKNKIVEIKNKQDKLYEPEDINRNSKIKASVSIMEGCNNFCSYCIVPYVRGREISRKKNLIIDQIKKLADKGYKEVTLLGQNVNSYKDDDCDFADLLEAVNNINGISRIRFMTSHPKDISEKLIKKCASLSNVCEHFHFPLQAGSDKVLKSMNRNYTLEKYLGTVDYLKKIIPDVTISTDIIVGFPGETEEDFKKTVYAFNHIRFDSAYMFHYSIRPGTKAADLEDDVPYEEKLKRLQYLQKLQESILEEKNRHLLGKEIEIMVEGTSKKKTSRLTGRTRTNKIVVFPDDGTDIGEFIKLKIIETGAYTLFGERV